MFPVVEPAGATSFKRLLRDRDIRIINAEYFPVMPDRDVVGYLPAITFAAELGAKRLVTHIHESDGQRAEDQLATLCTLAWEHGLDVGLEFTGFASGCNSLTSAVALHRRMNRSNLAIAIDALHLFRTGGTLEQLEAVDPSTIGYVQLCDGPDFRLSNDYLAEAMNRMIPGEGVFPLRDLVAQLGPHVDIDIEVPTSAITTGSGRRIWAERAIGASRDLFRQE